jgi:metal-sulfur cluster biosynthetic enzyme
MITQEAVYTQLKTVLDPELGINIVDLGLIYGVSVQGGVIHIDLTLTTPACPLLTEFLQTIHQSLKQLPGVSDVVVDLVFDPPWTPAKMSPEAAEELGMI